MYLTSSNWSFNNCVPITVFLKNKYCISSIVCCAFLHFVWLNAILNFCQVVPAVLMILHLLGTIQKPLCTKWTIHILYIQSI